MTFATILIFILALCVLIVVHEFGHFFAAKLFGIRVDEFAIGFPPRIAAFRAGETEYSVNILLFGGFVRIYGEQLSDEKTEDRESPRRSFSHRSKWVQAVVVIAGIVMNFVLAWVLLSAVYMIGMPAEVDASNAAKLSNVRLMVVEVLPNSPADKAGLEMGDVITSLQTATTTMVGNTSSSTAQHFIATHPDSSIILGVLRGATEEHFLVRPQTGVISNDPTRKAIGVGFDTVGTLRLDPFHALISGATLTWQASVTTAEFLGDFFYKIFSGHADLSQVSGPIGIVAVGSQQLSHGVIDLLTTLATISISLGIINIVPIPGLDGGRLLFIAIEGIRRRPVSEVLITRLTIAGFALLGLLLITVSYRDFFHYIAPHL
jgi:regulator of sigma E protease